MMGGVARRRTGTRRCTGEEAAELARPADRAGGRRSHRRGRRARAAPTARRADVARQGGEGALRLPAAVTGPHPRPAVAALGAGCAGSAELRARLDGQLRVRRCEASAAAVATLLGPRRVRNRARPAGPPTRFHDVGAALSPMKGSGYRTVTR